MYIYTFISTYKGTYSIASKKVEPFVIIHFYAIFFKLMSPHQIKGYVSLGILLSLLMVSGVWYANSPAIHPIQTPPEAPQQAERPLREGKHILINLDTMKVELRNSTTTLETHDILTVGKPGSYYETIGGVYENDYKIKKHFSSIGHVYMPWSTHVFGNYFIHGIPYHTDGTQVSSTYSGGCIRLSDESAERVYEFVEKGTPIIITENDEQAFLPTATSTLRTPSMDITRLMVAVISLEVLTQDNEITDTDGKTITTRRAILPRLLEGDDTVSALYAQALGEDTFLSYMNQKAQALGMSNTRFSSLTEPVLTTEEDSARFAHYLRSYKTYLLTLSSSTQELSQ